MVVPFHAAHKGVNHVDVVVATRNPEDIVRAPVALLRRRPLKIPSYPSWRWNLARVTDKEKACVVLISQHRDARITAGILKARQLLSVSEFVSDMDLGK